MRLRPKRFEVRHRVLSILSKRYMSLAEDALNNDKSNASYNDIPISVKDISDEIDISIPYLKECCVVLVKRKEVKFSTPDGVEKIGIDTEGLASYSDRKYLNEGQKLALDNFYDVFKSGAGIALLIIAVLTFILNTCQTKSNRQKIEQLSTEIKLLKQSSRQVECDTTHIP